MKNANDPQWLRRDAQATSSEPPTPDGRRPWYRKKRWIAAMAAGLLVVALAVTPSADAPETAAGDDRPVEVVTERVTEVVTERVEVPEPEPEPVNEDPQPDDFTVDLVVMEEQCFGSAGCNVTVEPDLTHTGDGVVAAGTRLVYEITGDEDGPVTETLTMLDDGQYQYDQVQLSTTQQGAELSAEVTTVR